jgi:hypothetical protein
MDLIDAAREFGRAVYDGINAPGDLVVKQLASVLPGLGPGARCISAGALDPLALLISLVAWLLLALLLLRVYRVLKRIARRCNEALAAIRLRLRLAKARFTRSLMQLFGAGGDGSGIATGTVDFDGTDIAVLRVAKSQPAGYTISVPDLVAHFRLRPSVVQKSLERLSENRLLEPVIGHTDGYENYRLTSTGAAFVRSME